MPPLRRRMSTTKKKLDIYLGPVGSGRIQGQPEERCPVMR
jgi:hypothetical protein